MKNTGVKVVLFFNKNNNRKRVEIELKVESLSNVIELVHFDELKCGYSFFTYFHNN